MENNIKNKFPVNLIKGEIALWKSYWLFGVLGNIVSAFLVSISSIVSLELMFIVSIIALAYSICVLIGIWNSASNYTGSKVWTILAKIMVVLGVLATLSQFNQ